ncbi:hypothetical protein AX17_000404 [Amanita inopinata Kibby_2008]|nr:hypothetical protein AX17_000404 [Amanita inopinata Kibby_2008]
MLFKFRRKEVPWEVVDSRAVEPVLMFDDDDEIEIEVIGEVDIVGTYVFDVKAWRGSKQVPNALVFARQQLLREVTNKGYNVLLHESWTATVYRRAKDHRVEIRYGGRPARVVGKVNVHACPPFLGILQASH